jgi:hypothetical protein
MDLRHYHLMLIQNLLTKYPQPVFDTKIFRTDIAV